MDDTEVAVIDYLPGPWPKDANIVCIARRTRIPADRIPTGRARKRRTIDKDQLALALEGRIDEVYGYSFILTDLDVSTEDKLAEAEFWYRHRTDIEELNRDAKHGTALRHLPSASHAVNSVWMWAGLLGCALSAWIQEITGLGHGKRTRPQDRGPPTPGTDPHPGPHQPPGRRDPATPTTRTAAARHRPAGPTETTRPRLTPRTHRPPARRKTTRDPWTSPPTRYENRDPVIPVTFLIAPKRASVVTGVR